MADDLTIEVTGSAEKAASALDKIIQKITDLQERFDKAAPSVSKFASQMEQIASSSKAFQAFQKMAGGIDKQAVSTKNAESKMAMYQARLDRANVSMERSRVQSEKLAASLGKVSEAQKMAANNSAAFSMPAKDFAAKFSHTDVDGAVMPESTQETDHIPTAVNAAFTQNLPPKTQEIHFDTSQAQTAVEQLGAFIDRLTPEISHMSAEAQAQFSSLSSRLMIVGQQIDNQRALYHRLAVESGQVAKSNGEGSAAYLQIEKRMLAAAAAADKLSATQERIKAQLSDIAAAAEGAGAGMSEAGEESEKGAKKAQSGWYQTWNMFSKMMIRIAAFRVFSAIQQGITTGLQDIALANNQANATMSALASNSLYLKNSLGAALMPVLQALVPVLNQVTDALANVFNTIGMLIGRIFNHATTAVIAKRANVDYAATISKAGDSAANTTKKVKELQRTVMGFDELNIMQKQISESEPASAAAKNPNPGMPAYGDMFETVKIPDWINNVGNFTDTIGKIIGGWWNGLTDAQKWGAGIGGTAGFIIGGIIGNLIGGPIGRIVGSILGGVIGTITGAWWAGLTAEEKWATGIGAGAGTVIGGIIGHLIGGKVGAAVGIALGGAAGIAIGKWWTDLTTPQKWSAGIGATAGTIIGGVIGGLLTGGNPIGIAVGAAVTGALGGMVGEVWADLSSADFWGISASTGVGAIIGGIIGSAIAPGIGTAVGAMLGGVLGVTISTELAASFSSISFQPLSDKVSQSTQTALSKFDSLYKGADEDLKQLEWSGDTVTKSMADKIKKNVDGMADQTIAGFNKQKDDSIAAIRELSEKGGTISKDEMDAMVKNVGEKYDERIAKEGSAQKQISSILQNASDNHRGLTQTESDTINKLKSQMYSSGVSSLSKNQVEEQAIYDNMRINHTATNAKEAAAIVKSSKETTDKVISDANTTYDQKVAAIIRERDETHSISSDEADKLIKAAGKERDEKVKAAQDGHQKVVDEAKKQSGDLVNQVDWQNGTVKSKFTVFWDWYSSTVKKRWSDALNGIKDNWNNFWGWYGTTVKKNWSDFGSWMQSGWDKNVAPWFTKEKWQSLGKQAADAITAPFKNIHWPKISTPHLSWDSGGWQSTGWIYNVLNALHLPTQMPKLNIDWYAKGGLFTAPSLVGVGEAGPEAALPLNDKVFSQIAQGIIRNSQSDNWESSLDTERIIQRMDKMQKAIEDLTIYVYSDDRKIAESANRGNRLLGRTAPTA